MLQLCSSAGGLVPQIAVHHWWCFISPMGVAREMGSENPARVGSELAGTPLLGAQSNLKALVLMGCEQRMQLGCRSWVGFYGSRGKILFSGRWAAHTDDQLHLPADRVSRSQDCFPAFFLDGKCSPSLRLAPFSLSQCSLCRAWKFYGFGGQGLRMGQRRGRWFHTHENTVCKQGMWKTPQHSKFCRVKE